MSLITTIYDRRIQEATRQYLPGYDWRLLKAQYAAESSISLDPTLVSPKGARGIAQFMPKTWDEVAEQLGLPKGSDPHAHNPDIAIPAGAHYMARMLKGWIAPRPGKDRICLALASYNAGFGNLLKAQELAGEHRGCVVNDYAGIIAALPGVPGVNADEPTAYVKRILRYYNLLVTEG